MRTLILYTSKTGSTKKYAEDIAHAVNGDVFPLKKYKWKDVGDYDSIVFGGLEPLDQLPELISLIRAFREKTEDPIVIYTGYKEEEIAATVCLLAEFPNIIVKFGRYIPDQKSHYDEILGVNLASDNQYARKLG